MRRIGNLFCRLDMDLLRKAADRACSTRDDPAEVGEFLSRRDELLEGLHRRIWDGTYSSSQYRTFTITENGKERLVADLPLYPDRILHHAVCMVCEAGFNSKLIGQTYASIPGRGHHMAVRRVYSYLRADPRLRYALVFDVRHFFQSIDKGRMKEKLAGVCKDARFLDLLCRLVDGYPLPGIPLGDRYSPMFANLYLSRMDHLLKERLHVHCYVRFMDDVCVLGYSKPWLRRILGAVRDCLAEEGLELKGNWQIFPVDSRGIQYLGYRIYTDHVLLRKPVKARMKRAAARVARHLEAGRGMSEGDAGTVASYRGVLRWCDGRNLERKVFGFLEEGRGGRLDGPPTGEKDWENPADSAFCGNGLDAPPAGDAGARLADEGVHRERRSFDADPPARPDRTGA